MPGIDLTTFSSFATLRAIPTHPLDRMKELLALKFEPVSLSHLYEHHGLDFSHYEDGTAMIAEYAGMDVIMAQTEHSPVWELICVNWEVDIDSVQEIYRIEPSWIEF